MTKIINDSVSKYRAFKAIDISERQWPSNSIKQSPKWCSVDLRDGNQALIEHLNLLKVPKMLLFMYTIQLLLCKEKLFSKVMKLVSRK